jgi:membrane-bound serine protease (ClpP class)
VSGLLDTLQQRAKIMIRRIARPADNRGWLQQARRFSVFLLATIAVTAPAFPQNHKRVAVTDVSGAIGVATTRQLTLAIERAQTERAEALIIRLDTPGGS